MKQLSTAQLALLTALAVVPTVIWLSRVRKDGRRGKPATNDAAATDPGLLKKHSQYRSYHVPGTGFTYPSIRTVYRAHPQSGKLPSKPAPLPLLVFVHGLGGSSAQFAPLLTSLVNVGPCLCIDLPGCGLSEFSPTDWDAYSADALVQLLAVVIESYRDVQNKQGVIFFAHSLGTSLCALLASATSKYASDLSKRTIGFIAMCPRITPYSETVVSRARYALHAPTVLFDVWRAWDRRAGQESDSVRRFVGAEAETEAKRLTLRYNSQSKTPVWRRMAYGALPVPGDATSHGAIVGDEVWAGLDMPVFLIAGEADTVTPPDEIKSISNVLQKAWKGLERDDDHWIELPPAPTPNQQDDESSPSTSDPAVLKPPRALKTIVLPSPASHGLIFAPSTSRAISGLIQSFLADHVDRRLSLGWQLQYLSTEGKWDVKNLEKWKSVTPVSEPIGGVFRAMKTMREVDDCHCPKVFVQHWSGKIHAVIDISHESPVYDPSGLDDGGIEYHKFPTVSKLPPSPEEVHTFIELVDRLQEGIKSKGQTGQKSLIAVHCHYGFNRTGFFIVCYLIERMGWRLQDAVDEFEKARPPGIKHDYFVNSLYVRYHVGLEKAPTL